MEKVCLMFEKFLYGISLRFNVLTEEETISM